jgi:excisionase family DNA binding protein
MPTHSASPPDLIGSAEVARLLKINQVTVARWVASGQLTPAHKLPGKNGAYLFNRADVDQLISDRAEASA